VDNSQTGTDESLPSLRVDADLKPRFFAIAPPIITSAQAPVIFKKLQQKTDPLQKSKQQALSLLFRAFSDNLCGDRVVTSPVF
jgi:hypothetical protein